MFVCCNENRFKLIFQSCTRHRNKDTHTEVTEYLANTQMRKRKVNALRVSPFNIVL